MPRLGQRWKQWLVTRVGVFSLLTAALAGCAAFTFLRLGSEMREGEMGGFDIPVERWIDATRGHWDGWMLAMTNLAGPLGAVLCTLAVCGLFLLRRRVREAITVASTAAGAMLINVALKALFHRARPAHDLDYLLKTPTSFSFPSGHTMFMAGLMASTLFCLFRLPLPAAVRVAGAIAGTLVALGVATSRVYFGAHFPSDVLGGLLASTAWACAVQALAYRAVPRAVPTGARGGLPSSGARP